MVAREVGDHKRGARSPPFVFAVGLDDAGAGRVQAASLHQPVAPAAQGIIQGLVGEREQVRLPGRILGMPRIAPGLAEAIVRRHATAAADMRHQPVEHQPAGEVFVETEIKKIAQEASGLRDAEADRALDKTAAGGERICRCGIAPEKGNHIAGGRKSHSQHGGVACRVGHLVECAGIETAGGPGDLDRLGACRAYRKPGRLLPRGIPFRPHGHREGRRIRNWPRHRRGGRAARMIEHEFVARRAGDALQHGRGQRQLAGLGGNVGLPADPCHRVALAVEKSDSGIRRLLGIVGAGLGCVVEQLRRKLSAAIGNVDQKRAVGAERIGGAQQHDIGGGLDPAAFVARSLVDVGDDCVARVSRVDGNGCARP